MKKDKILMVTPFFPPDRGGIANHVLNLSQNLVKNGFDVSIICPAHNHSYVDEDFSIRRIKSIYLPGWPYPTLKSVSIPVDLGREIRSVIQSKKFEIVHIHGHHYPFSWIAVNAAFKVGIPNVLTLHGMYALNPNTIGGRSWIEDYFNKYFFAKMLLKSNAVIGLTTQITNYAKKFGNNSSKHFTIPNGVNTNSYQQNLSNKIEFRKKYGIKNDSKVILFCGRLEQVKGIVEFVGATKNLVKREDLEVVIVGKGSLDQLVKSELSGLDRVHILGWQPAETLYEIYIASDIFINPSKFEALPITILEAMNAGLHIVYTPVGGIPDIMKDYTPKTSISKVTSEEIEKILAQLLSNFRSEINENSLNYAQKFDWKQIAIEISSVYEQCIKSI